MKLFYSMLPAISLVIGMACKKGKRHTTACGVENPIKNIPWLKHAVDSLAANTPGGVITLFSHEGHDYFALRLAPMACAFCFWYTCDGTPMNSLSDSTLINTLSLHAERKTLYTYGIE
ncbi:MAG: hypothetical protein J0H74_33530 [Chitinophagaceae bacterium]|nr:hypothetical protein [Chitinophagaceae bacterium]